jgi:hypothetical protein
VSQIANFSALRARLNSYGDDLLNAFPYVCTEPCVRARRMLGAGRPAGREPP